MDISNYFKYLLCCIAFTLIASTSYANSSNPTWDYNVTKDSSNKINVTGSKNITVNGKLKTLTSTIKDFKPSKGLIGRTMHRRILAGAGGLGVAAVTGFLHTKGWYLDTLTGFYVLGASQKYLWNCGGTQHDSPSGYAACMLGVLQQQNPSYEFAINTIENDKEQVRVVFDKTASNLPAYHQSVVVTNAGTVVTEQEDVKPASLTSETLDDILTDPVVNTESIGVAEALTPDIANGEISTSLESYRDISQSLDSQAVYPSETDVTSTSTTVDAATGSQSTTTTDSLIPEFCDWATLMCDFVKWFQDDSAIPEPEKYEIEEFDKSNLPTDPQFNFNGQCPAPYVFTLDLGLVSQEISLPYDFLCTFAINVKPFVILAAWLHACFIFSGFRNS